jgi:UDP:flavonoid glycosyltransferase YjiC (YdhE family)
MRDLFTAQPGAGHWRSLAPLAWALEREGHEVAFATTPTFCGIIAEYGFRCFPAGIDDWVEPAGSRRTQAAARREPAQAEAVWVEQFAGSRAARTLPDLLRIGEVWRPDAIVREISEFAGCITAERLGVPHAAVQISALRPLLERAIAGPLNRLRESVGLPPDPALEMLYRYLLLCPVPPSVQDASRPLPAAARAVGYVPIDREPGDDGLLPGWVGEVRGRPLVFATLGTAYNRTPGVLAAIVEALGDEPVTLLVTTGDGVEVAELGAPRPNVHIERYVPQSLIFPQCDVAITHGGFGTVMTALGQGLPLVVIPIAADQPDNGRCCAELGVAVVVAPDRRTPEVIREAARTVLGDGKYRERAERLRDEMRGLPDLGYAVRLVERLVAERRPLRSSG